MKQYTADKHAQYTLQIATPIVTAVLIGLVWYFLGSAAPLAAVDTDGSAGGGGDPAVHTAAAYVVLHCDLLCIGEPIHPENAAFFSIQEQVMRTQALQFSSIFQAPFADATGMNFIPLHAYGGTVILSFLSSSDAAEIQAFLQKTVYSHSQRTLESACRRNLQTFRRSRSRCV